MSAGSVACAIVAMVAASFSSAGARPADGRDGSVVQVLGRFGLQGVWAPDCHAPVAIDNPRLSVDLSTLGLPEIRAWNGSPYDAGEFIQIASARLLSADMLELKLNSLTSDPTIFYDRTDTYQRIGIRVRLWRSERTWASEAAQALGYGAQVLRTVETDADPARGEPLSPLGLERCDN